MIRYVLCTVDGKEVRMVLHAFVQKEALVEDPSTGKVTFVPADSLTFDPPTEVLFQAQMRQAAAGGGPGPMILPRTGGN